jgi:hypothetical protein
MILYAIVGVVLGALVRFYVVVRRAQDARRNVSLFPGRRSAKRQRGVPTPRVRYGNDVHYLASRAQAKGNWRPSA